MPLSDVLTVSIIAQTQGVTQQGFNDALILGSHTHFSERVRIYNALTEMVSDGFTTTEPEYRAVSALFSQNPRPARVFVGRRANRPTMTWTLTPVVGNSTVYQLKVNGSTVTFTSDSSATAAEITAGLKTQIDALSAALTVTAGSTSVDVAANAAGAWHSIESLTPLTLLVAMDHSDAGVAADLDAIRLENDDWYALVHTTNSLAEGLAVAAWTETNKKLFICQTSDTASGTSATDDLLSELEDAEYARTAGVYHPDPRAFNDAAWLGTVLPFDPGSRTWKFKTPAGVSRPTLTGTQRTNLRNKNANFLDNILGTNIMTEGTTASGEFIDITHGIDWLTARISEAIAQALIASPKIPFSNGGIGVIESAIRGELGRGITIGFLAEDPTPSVTTPKYSDVSTNDRANRRLTGVSFSARASGAIHGGDIVGTITV